MEKITTDNAEIQRIIIDYYEQLYGNKMDNFKEMDEFLQKYKLSKPNQEEINNLNRLIKNTEIETVIYIYIFQKSKAQEQVASQVISISNLEKT